MLFFLSLFFSFSRDCFGHQLYNNCAVLLTLPSSKYIVWIQILTEIRSNESNMDLVWMILGMPRSFWGSSTIGGVTDHQSTVHKQT